MMIRSCKLRISKQFFFIAEKSTSVYNNIPKTYLDIFIRNQNMISIGRSKQLLNFVKLYSKNLPWYFVRNRNMISIARFKPVLNLPNSESYFMRDILYGNLSRRVITLFDWVPLQTGFCQSLKGVVLIDGWGVEGGGGRMISCPPWDS